MSFFQLEVIGVEGSGCALPADEQGVRAAHPCLKAYADPGPAAIDICIGSIFQIVTGPAVPVVIQDFQVDAVSGEGHPLGVHISGEGVGFACR